ncbi:hypothetical protein EV356DRAFT_506638 [Viridothelium virens]|uniref:Uncharacterized protein n=1 Tax=Viridothelium virens TaxID=1048519 RepID=A0A6A6H0W3_VIRVR|nr:hypothetical protein EV356DRAFT_506638 [Viridothelium virens]
MKVITSLVYSVLLLGTQAVATIHSRSNPDFTVSDAPKNARSIHILDPQKDDSLNQDLTSSFNSKNGSVNNIHYVDKGPPKEYRARLPNNTHPADDADNDMDAQSVSMEKRDPSEGLVLLEVRGGWDCEGRKHSMKGVLEEFSEATYRWDRHASSYSFESHSFPLLYDPYIRIPGLSSAKTTDFADASFVPLLLEPGSNGSTVSETQKHVCDKNYMYLWPLPQECPPPCRPWRSGDMEPKDFVVFGAYEKFVDMPYKAIKKGKVSKKLDAQMKNSEKSFLAPCSVVTRKTHFHKAATWEEYRACSRFETDDGMKGNKVEKDHPDGKYLTWVEGPP